MYGSTLLTQDSTAAGIISIIVWLFDLLLFILISVTFFTRWVRFTESTVHMFSSDVEQTTYLATSVIASATLVELISLQCGSTWHNWQYACFALWWATVALAFFAAATTYYILICDEEVELSNLSATLVYPTTGLLATASSGSIIIDYTPLSIRLSMPVLVVAYLCLGAGVSSSLHVVALVNSFEHRLLPRSSHTGCVLYTFTRTSDPGSQEGRGSAHPRRRSL